MIKHTNCDHDKTLVARRRCRRGLERVIRADGSRTVHRRATDDSGRPYPACNPRSFKHPVDFSVTPPTPADAQVNCKQCLKKGDEQ